jgi:hypothetical protein
MLSSDSDDDNASPRLQRTPRRRERLSKVPWLECMAYERTELLNELGRVFSQRLFAPDDVKLTEVDNVRCVTGHAPDVTRGLLLTGTASKDREELYSIIEGKVRAVASDFMCRISFGASVHDPLPPTTLIEVLPSTRTNAKRMWQRAMWAVRCGVVKKIGDARVAPPPARRSSDVTPTAPTIVLDDSTLSITGDDELGTKVSDVDSEVPRRPFQPVARYHAEVASNGIDFRRFAINSPAVYVLWASWDTASMEFLQRFVFAAPPDAACGMADDPWLAFMSRYVDLGAFHAGVVDDEVAAGKATTAAAAEYAKGVRRSVPAVFRSYVMPQDAADAELPAMRPDDDGDVPVDVDRLRQELRQGLKKKPPAPALTRRESSLRIRPKKRGQILEQRTQQRGHARAAATAAKFQEQRGKSLRLGHIVLVNLDADADTAAAALLRMRRDRRAWASPVVALHCMWGGPGGMHSDVGAFFNAAALPYICAAEPRRAPLAGDAHMWYETPAITLVHDIERMDAVARRPSVASANAAPPNSTLPRWHELPRERREAAATTLCELQQRSDGQLVLEVTCEAEYDLLGGAVTDSTLQTLAQRHSAVTLRGSAPDAVVGQMEPILRELRRGVQGIFCDIDVLESTQPVRLALNERTAEHRVHGWLADVTCVHCRARIHLATAMHYHCLHCIAPLNSVCEACCAAHDASHVLLLAHQGSAPTLKLTWGSTNVGTLPLMRGRLIATVTNCHVAVYCNSCFVNIVGVRWKCASCQDADLCEGCFALWLNSVKLGRADRRHDTAHNFLRISCAVPGDVLTPTFHALAW